MWRLAALLSMFLAVGFEAKAETAVNEALSPDDPALLYANDESARIMKEGDRIKGEAARLRSESGVLRDHADILRGHASELDHQWAVDKRAANLREYPGYNRSQQRMRHHAASMDSEAVDLTGGAAALDREAVKLWKLSAAVDPKAMKALLERLRCCNTPQAPIQLLREQIVQMAAAAHVHYLPQ